MRIIFGSIVVFLLFTSCKEENTIQQSKSLEGAPVESIKIYSGGNVNLAVIDTFLVIQKSEEPFIHIYNTNTHQKLVEFGKKGRGPDEFLGPSLMKQISYDSSNNSPLIKIFDYKRQEINTINIFHAIENKVIKTQEALDSNGNFLLYFFYKDEDFYVATPENKGRFVIYNYNTSEINITPYLPETDFDIPKLDLSAVYRSTSFVNIDKELIASASYFFGQLDFFDLKGNHIRSTTFEPSNKFENELKAGSDSWKNIQLGIDDLDAKGEYIFGLNFNNSISTYLTPKRTNNPKIQVFNWEGLAIKEYTLDNRLITAFAIDTNHDRIYAYSPNEEDHNIVIYKMK